MNNVNKILEADGTLSCTCDAKAKPGEHKRFLKRHPELCSKRQEFTAQLARGTKSVDDEEARYRAWAAFIEGEMPRFDNFVVTETAEGLLWQ